MVFHVVEQADKDACAAGTDGMTKGDGTAAWVQPLHIKAEQAGAAEGLNGEGLVDLDGIDLFEVPAGAVANAADGSDRTESHQRGITTDSGAGDDAGARGELVLGDGFVTGKQDAGSSVVDAGGVASGDAAVFAEGGLELGEGLDGGVGARVLVLADDSIRAGDGDDLAGESGAVRGGEALAACGKGVLLSTGDAELVGDAFSGLAHADAEHGVGEAIKEKGVLQGDGTKLLAPAGIERVMRGAAHDFDTAGEDKAAFAEADGIGAKGNRFQRRATGHVDGVGRSGFWQAEFPPGLPGDVHATAGLEDLAQNDLLDVRAEIFRDDGAGDSVREVGGGERFEAAAEAADGRAFGSDEVDGGHDGMGECWCVGFSRSKNNRGKAATLMIG